jgi:hypothetical protein
MKFLHNDLGVLHGNELIEVTLDKAANVKLMDGANFSRYRAGRDHRFFGGYVTRSPCRIAVPSAGHWHLAIDLGGYAGSVRAGIRLLG